MYIILPLPHCSFDQLKSYSETQRCGILSGTVFCNGMMLLPLAGVSARCGLVYPGTLRGPSNPLLLTDGTVSWLTNCRSCRHVGSKQKKKKRGWLGCCCKLHSKVSGFILLHSLAGTASCACSRLASLHHHLTCSVVAVRDPDFQALDAKKNKRCLSSSRGTILPVVLMAVQDY